MNASRSRARVAAAGAAALLAGTTAAWATDLAGARSERDGTPSPAATSPLRTPTERFREPSQPVVRTTARDARPDSARTRALAAPARFEVAELGISMPVRPVGVAGDGQMDLPPSPALMGWYEHGPRPGDPEGATVMAAHRDMPEYGTGPAARLERLDVGDLLTVRSGGTVRRYRVTQVTQLDKETLDLDAIFSRTGAPRLHVVTCSGRFDLRTRTYERNLVVVGVPIP